MMLGSTYLRVIESWKKHARKKGTVSIRRFSPCTSASGTVRWLKEK